MADCCPRSASLLELATLPPGPRESAVSLEQLRWLENGRRMRVVIIERAHRGVDTAEDYAAFVARQGAAESDSSPNAPHPQEAST